MGLAAKETVMSRDETGGLTELSNCLSLYADVADQIDTQDIREAANLVAASFAGYLAELRGRGHTTPLVDALSAVMRAERVVGDRPSRTTATSITITASYTIRVKKEEAVYHLALRRIRKQGLEEFDELHAYRDSMSSVAALYEVDGWQPDSYGTDAIEVLDANWSIGKTRKV
jgi:hypothetical protein